MDDKVQIYIDKLQSPQKEILQKIRELIQHTAPAATEALSYGVPAFKLNGNLVLYAAFKNHIGIYPEPDTIKFNLAEPIPFDLIEKIVKYRVRMMVKQET